MKRAGRPQRPTADLREAMSGRLDRLDPAALARLEALDLVARRGDGAPALTDAGLAHLRRSHHAASGSPVDSFRAQHLALETRSLDMNGSAAAVTANAAESPLAWLARRKGSDGRPMIGSVQLQAGERLRAEFSRAGMGPRTTFNWDATVRQGRRSGANRPRDFAESQLAARQRVTRALEAVGPEFAGLLLDVCCFLKGLEDVERERRWPPRSAKVVLQLGLDRLARHFGFGTVAHGKAHAAVRTWHADHRALCDDPLDGRCARAAGAQGVTEASSEA